MAPTEEKIKVLLVDDDNFLLDIYVMKFKEKGVGIKVVSSGEKAMEVLRERFEPDIVIIDLVMPTMDGMELFDAMKKEKLASSSTTIFLTNQSDEESRKRAEAMGIEGYIVKASMTPSEVLEKVLEVYKGHSKEKKEKGNN